MPIQRSHFSLVGSRDYIQGIVIVTTLCEAICREGGQGAYLASLIKFPHITDKNGTLGFCLGDEEPVPDHVNCLVVGTLGDQPAGGYFLADASQAPAPRVPNHQYNILDFVVDDAYSGSCRLTVNTAAELALHLVEASKRMVAQSLVDLGRSERRIELVSMENFPYFPDMGPSTIDLTVKNSGVNAYGPRLYVRTRLGYSLPDGGTASASFTYSAH